MTKPMIRIHNIETDEIIDREMTAAEIKVHEADKKVEQTLKAEAEAQKMQRQAILDRLGLTADELKTILG
jgi:hypothetical protein